MPAKPVGMNLRLLIQVGGNVKNGVPSVAGITRPDGNEQKGASILNDKIFCVIRKR